ncbi:MAG: hypothetical protein FWC85_01265 [Elusimicrobia bacterium]|nr:hypothetical protein [Elusimicrobiota bacterium]
MAVNEIKSVAILPLVKVLPIVFGIVGTVIGLFMFFFFPTDIAASLGFGQRFLAWLMFIAFYTAIMVAGAVAVAWLYNMVSAKLGMCVSVNIEKKDEF